MCLDADFMPFQRLTQLLQQAFVLSQQTGQVFLSTSASRASPLALTVALRGAPVNSDISPNIRPLSSWATSWPSTSTDISPAAQNKARLPVLPVAPLSRPARTPASEPAPPEIPVRHRLTPQTDENGVNHPAPPHGVAGMMSVAARSAVVGGGTGSSSRNGSPHTRPWSGWHPERDCAAGDRSTTT